MIHMNLDMMEPIMAAASNTLDICTIGKMRSYHSEINGKLFFHTSMISTFYGVIIHYLDF